MKNSLQSFFRLMDRKKNQTEAEILNKECWWGILKPSGTIVMISKNLLLPFIHIIHTLPKIGWTQFTLIFEDDNGIEYALLTSMKNMGQHKRVAESRCHLKLRKELLLLSMRICVANYLDIVSDFLKDRNRMDQLQFSERFLDSNKIKTVQAKLAKWVLFIIIYSIKVSISL